jgi:hypothetical protein
MMFFWIWIGNTMAGSTIVSVNLIAIGERPALAAELDAALPRSIARTHGRLTLGVHAGQHRGRRSSGAALRSRATMR